MTAGSPRSTSLFCSQSVRYLYPIAVETGVEVVGTVLIVSRAGNSLEVRAGLNWPSRKAEGLVDWDGHLFQIAIGYPDQQRYEAVVYLAVARAGCPIYYPLHIEVVSDYLSDSRQDLVRDLYGMEQWEMVYSPTEAAPLVLYLPLPLDPWGGQSLLAPLMVLCQHTCQNQL